MSLQRFTFALQHEDPAVVQSGLRSFRDLCLAEHSSVLSFGYNGRCGDATVAAATTRVTGLLAAYIRSSPRLEELFVLWGLPELDADRTLATSLVQCLSVILHCAVGEETFCTDIVSRILHERCKAIKDQLGSGNVTLVHATLGLLLSMSRTSPQNCRDLYSRCIVMCVPTLSTLTQKGKAVSWEPPVSSASTFKLSTDSRTLIIILVLKLLQCADTNLLNDFFGPSSLIRKITNTVDRDTLEGAGLLLRGLHDWLRDSGSAMLSAKNLLIDANMQQRLLEMYKSADETLQQPLHALLVSYCHTLCEGIRRKSSGPGATSVCHSGALQLIFKLDAHLDLRHRELQSILVSAHPSLLAKCISSINASWEPGASHVFLCAMSHLCRLVGSVDIGPHVKSAVRKIRDMSTGRENEKGARAEAIRTLVSDVFKGMLPPTLAKKDLVKIFLSSNALVQRMGLVYLLGILQRISKVLAIGSGLQDLAAAFGRAVHETLPDFTLLARLRTIYVDLLQGEEKDKAIYFLSLIHQIMEGYISLSHASALGNLDILRLLDDIVSWPAGESVQAAHNLLDSVDSKLLLLTLRLLRQATLTNSCKWFGSSDEAKKMLSNILVSQDWRSCTKRGPLAKLLLIAACAHSSHQAARKSASDIFKILLAQSELFSGHGVVDYELGQELGVWRGAVSTSGASLDEATCDSVLLIDLLLRLTYHWVAVLALQAAAAVTASALASRSKGSFYASSLFEHKPESSDPVRRALGNAAGECLPFSPLLYCALTLSCGNFDAFASQLPVFIRRRVCDSTDDAQGDDEEDEKIDPSQTPSTGAALIKFTDTLLPSLQHLTIALLSRASAKARNREAYGQLTQIVCEEAEAASRLQRSSRAVKFTDLVHGVKLALSASHIEVSLDSVEAYSAWREKVDVSGAAKPSKSAKKSVSSEELDLLPLVHLKTTIESSWFLSACLALKDESRGLDVATTLQDIVAGVEAEEQAVSHGGTLEARAVLLRQCLDVLYLLCLKSTPSLDPASSLSLKSKKRKADVSNDGVENVREKLIALLTRVSMDIAETTQTAPLVATALYTAYLERSLLEDSIFGRCCRQIMCTASLAYLRRHASLKKSAKVSAPAPIWGMIARALYSVGRNDFTRIAGDVGLFTLGWVVQRFVNHAAFRSLFVDVALLEGEGHRLLEMTLGKVEDRDSEGAGNSVCTPLDAVAMLVLKSAASTTLTTALQTSLGYVSGPIVSQANALYALSVGLRMHTSMSRGWHHPRLHYFCDPMALVTPVAISALCAELATRSPQLLPQLLAMRPTLLMPSTETINSATKLVLSLSQNSLPTTLRLQVPSRLSHLREIVACLSQKWCAIDPSSGLVTLVADRLDMNTLPGEDSDSAPAADLASIAVCKMLDSDSLRSNYSSNLAALLLRTSGSVLVQKHARLAFGLFAVSCTLPVLLGSSQEPGSVDLWAGAFEAVLLQALGEVSSILKEAEKEREKDDRSGAAGPNKQAYLRRLLLLCFHLLTLRVDDPQQRFKAVTSSLLKKQEAMKKRVNQWVRACLKFGLHDENVMSILCAVVWQNGSAKKVKTRGSIAAVFEPSEADFYHPSTLLSMIVGHSKFTQVLWSARGGSSEALLAVILRLVCLVTSSLPLTGPASAEGEFAFLVNALLPLYTGTLSQSNRTTLRILHLLSSVGKCASLCTLKAKSIGSSATSSNQALSRASDAGQWIASCLNTSNVYSSFQQPCLWRTIVPQPLAAEGALGSELYATQMRGIYREAERAWSDEASGEAGQHQDGRTGGEEDMEVIREGLPGDGLGDDDMDEGGEGEAGDADEEDEEEHMDLDEQGTEDEESSVIIPTTGIFSLDDPEESAPRTDRPASSSDKVYDLCYWLPAAQHALASREVSIRQLANNGMLSLIILGLSSACPLLRSYALSCLQLIFTLLRRQGPDKDAGFRERPQLLLLISFVRNAIVGDDGTESGGIKSKAGGLRGPCPRLPPTVAGFLGRAALHLLQPTHDLFGKTNKYLLSRPFCDPKDVPLYEMCVVQGDTESEMGEKIAALRMLRDSFSSHDDHLNLCRKNAYQALTLLFPVLSTSAQAVLGHAILDVLDKALGMKHSARYLLERCMIVGWLRQQASVLQALKLVLPSSEAVTATSVRQDDEGNSDSDDDDEEKGAEPSRETVGSSAALKPSKASLLTWRGLSTRDEPASASQSNITAAKHYATYPLAAPARLVARTLSILRRALGAVFLSQQGSSLLGSVFMAGQGLIEEVSLLHSGGKASSVPRDVLRQLVLLLWDTSMVASVSGQSSSRGRSGAFNWTPHHIRALSQTLLASSHNAAVDADLDELLASLALLRAFESGQDVVAVVRQSAADDLAASIRLICGTTLKLLHHGGRLASSSNPLHALSRPQAKVDGVYYYAFRRRQHLDATRSAPVYTNIVHILHGDDPKATGGDGFSLEQESDGDKDGEGEGEEERLSRAWEALSDTRLETTALPTSLGQGATVALASRALLNSLRGFLLHVTVPVAAVREQAVLLEALRWVLLVRGVFGATKETGANGRRVLSTADGGSAEMYTGAYVEFLTEVRFAVASAWVFLALDGQGSEAAAAPKDAGSKNKSKAVSKGKEKTQTEDEGAVVVSSLRGLLASLGFPDKSADSPSSFRATLDAMEVQDVDAAASALWESEQGTSMLTLRTCRAALDVSATVISIVDRGNRTAAAAAAGGGGDESKAQDGIWAALRSSLEGDFEQREAVRCSTHALVEATTSLQSAHVEGRMCIGADSAAEGQGRIGPKVVVQGNCVREFSNFSVWV